jgi:hypothetical protein
MVLFKKSRFVKGAVTHQHILLTLSHSMQSECIDRQSWFTRSYGHLLIYFWFYFVFKVSTRNVVLLLHQKISNKIFFRVPISAFCNVIIISIRGASLPYSIDFQLSKHNISFFPFVRIHRRIETTFWEVNPSIKPEFRKQSFI